MAIFSGTHSCGHEGRINIIGPGDQRQRKADYYFSSLCDECRAKEYEEKREKANQNAKENAEILGLPQLTGSEKQVVWGTTLRQYLINYFNDCIKQVAEKEKPIMIYGRDRDYYLSIDHLCQLKDYALSTYIDSKFYIDNRFEKVDKLMLRFIKESKIFEQ